LLSRINSYRLNVFYLTLDKIQAFADGRYDISATNASSIEDIYVSQLSDATDKLEALTIRKPAMPSARLLQLQRGAQGMSPTGSEKSAGLAGGAPSKTGIGLGRSASGSKTSAPPAYTAGGAAAAAADAKRPPPPPPMKPKPGAATAVQHVVALYDYTATAEGDLSFNAGDRIEVVERTASAEDWWTGKVNGQQGVFPGNYVREE
jgi:amphiphysin